MRFAYDFEEILSLMNLGPMALSSGEVAWSAWIVYGFSEELRFARINVVGGDARCSSHHMKGAKLAQEADRDG